MKVADRQPAPKARNSVLNAKATNVSLAVFPYEIVFTANLDYTSAFYFEKDMQIIGTINTNAQQNNKQCTVALRDIENLIKFRIYTFHNLNYKWSHYRIYENEEQEFIESAAIDLKAYLGQLVPMNNIGSFRSHESYMLPCNIEKQLRVKLQKTGVIIKFLLLICEDDRQLEEAVRDRFFGRVQAKKIDKAQQPKQNENVAQEIKNNQNNDYKVQDIAKTQGIAQQIKCNKEIPKEGYMLDLDALILDNKQNQAVSGIQIVQQAQSTQKEEEDLCFGVQKPKISQQIDNQDSKAVPNPEKQEKKTNLRDYSLLKLESDQGRMMMDPIDRKLELEQLQMIQQEAGFSPSQPVESAANQESNKQTTNLPLKTESMSSKLESAAKFTLDNKLKLSIVLMLVLLTLIAIFIFPGQLKPSKKAKTKKALIK